MKNSLLRSNIFWFVVIFLASAYFRVLFLDLIEFKNDEATTVFQTVRFFTQPYLIERGLISGIGVYNFPLFNYLIIGLSIFKRDPQVITFVIGFINSILVAIFYLVIKRYYSFLTAVTSSFILAFSPWGVLFSRKIWAQDLLLLLFIPLFWLLHELLIKKNYRVTLYVFFLMALLVQLHASGIFFALATIVIFVVQRTRINIKQALIGILTGLIPTIPYIMFQVSSNPICPDCQNFLNYQTSIRQFDIYSFIRPLQVVNGLGYHFVLGDDYSNFITNFPIIDKLKYLFIVGFLIPLTGLFSILKKQKQYIFLIIYLVIIPSLYFLTKTKPFMHYFVLLLPLMVLLYGISFNYLYNLFKGNRFLKMGILLLVFIFIFSNVLFLSSFNSFLALKRNIQGDYGPVFRFTEEFLIEETKQYQSLDYYPELKVYAYMYAQSKDFHLKIGEFLIEKNEEDLAVQEFKKGKRE